MSIKQSLSQGVIYRAASVRHTRVVIGALIAALCGCTTINNSIIPSSSPQTVQEQAQEIEPMLDAAGFEPLVATNLEQKNRLRTLPSMKLGYYLDRHGAANYWLADPDYCGCLFHGDQSAYQRFQFLEKDNQTAKNDRQALQSQRYRQPFGPWGPPGFGPGMGFSFGPGMGFGGGFGFSL